MKTVPGKLRRIAYGSFAVALLGALLLPSLVPKALAAQVTSRSIQMSNSTASATGTAYQVSFTPVTTGAQSLIIDFCSNSSIIGASCTAPTGFSATAATFTAGTGTANWTLGTLGASTVRVTKSTGTALGTTAINFTLNNITNPSTTGTFYARVYTYLDTAYGGGTAYASPTNVGNDLDEGGFAMSTANKVTISATVMEQITFCVSKSQPTAGCGGTDSPDIILGTGSPKVLDSNAVYTDTAYTQLSTNANGGVSVRLKNTSSTTCSGLSRDNGATCGIPAKGTFGTVAAGTAFFGLNVANGTGGTGTVSANGNYGTTSGSYGMGTTAPYGTYGDPIESSPGATSNVNSLLTYAATANATTPAGVYRADHSMIATGTF